MNGSIILDKGVPSDSFIKNLLANARDVSSIPGSGKFLEKEMTTYCNIRTWEISWTEEAGGLHFMGSQKSQMPLCY